MTHRYYLSLLVLLFGHSVFGQIINGPYRPTVIEGATWIQREFQLGVSTNHHSFTMAGDTIVDSTVYKKLYRTPLRLNGPWPGSTPAWEGIGPPMLHSLIREDTAARRVYGRVPVYDLYGDYDPASPLTGDTLIHDFTWTARDTLKGIYTGFDNQIIQHDGVGVFFDGWRRFQQTEFTDRIIEGIGSERCGLFKGCAYAQQDETPVIEELVGYCVADDCYLKRLTSVQDRQTVTLRAYPNPTTGYLQLDGLAALGGDVVLTLYDEFGRSLVVVHGGQGGDMLRLDLANLPCGLYTYSVVGSKARAAGRVVRR